jgi:hypothetical protein
MFVHGALFLAISRTSDAAIPLVSSSANGDEARSNPNVLCYACSRMEFHDVSHEELKEWGYEAKISIDQLTFMVDYYTNERDGSGKRCDLCLVLRQDHYTNRWFPCLIEVIHDLFDDLKTNRQLAIDTAKFERGPRHSSRVIAYSLGIGGTFQPQQVPRLYDPSRAQSCLDNCKAHHNKACNQKTLTVEVMRLIDWERIEIVEARPVGSWLALSYVWGSKVTGGFSRRSKTVIDAIEVTKQLIYRYMWVEEYCIDQDDRPSPQRQSNPPDEQDLSGCGLDDRRRRWSFEAFWFIWSIFREVAEIRNCASWRQHYISGRQRPNHRSRSSVQMVKSSMVS